MSGIEREDNSKNPVSLGLEQFYLEQQRLWFTSKTDWLRDKYAEGGPDVQARVERGLTFALTKVEEINEIAGLIGNPWYEGIRERLEKVGGKNVVSAEVVCIDGRLIQWIQGMPRIMSRTYTPAGLLSTKTTVSSGEDLGNGILATAIGEKVGVGKSVLEFVGPHTSLRHNASKKHPLGCGAHNMYLASNRQHPSDFDDGGLAIDLVRDKRQNSEAALQTKGTKIVRRIIDTDTQGVVFVGDKLYEEVKAASGGKAYLALTQDEITKRHRKQEVIYTPLLAEEMSTFFAERKMEFRRIKWDSVGDLPTNIEAIVSGVETIMALKWRETIEAKVRRMYTRSGLSDEEVTEVAAQVAYNTTAVWLSGFTDEANVPDRFKHHGERCGSIGDKGLDTWVETSPFLIANGESYEEVERYLDIMVGLLPGILKGVHKVDIEEEAAVLFLTAPIDPSSSDESKTRVIGRSDFRERYRRILEHLKDLVYSGKLIVIPMLVDEKTRKVVEIVDFSRLY